MPASAVCNHNDPVFRMACCDFIQKDLHTDGIDVGQNQGIKYTVSRRNSRICVGIFLCHHCLAHRSIRLGTPTAPDIRYATKPGFILEHQPYGAFSRPLCAGLYQHFREFF